MCLYLILNCLVSLLNLPLEAHAATQGKVGGMLMRNSQRLPTKP